MAFSAMTTKRLSPVSFVWLSAAFALLLLSLFYLSVSPGAGFLSLPHQPFQPLGFKYTEDQPFQPLDFKDVDLHLLIPLTGLSSNALASSSSPAPYCRTLLTSLLQGYTPILLDLGQETTWEEGTSKKVKVVASYVDALEEEKEDKEQVVVMVDGWDVWFQAGPEELFRRYNGQQGITLGADKTCWPIPPDQSEACTDVPHSPLMEELNRGLEEDLGIPYTAEQEAIRTTRPRFPNSGTVMATSSLLKPFYQHLLAHSVPPHPLAPGLPIVPVNDQELFIRTFYTDHLPSSSLLSTNFFTQLDYSSNLFGTTLYSLSDYKVTPSSDGERKVFKNIKTGKAPVAMHFNGKEGKVAAQMLWRDAWWVGDHSVRAGFEEGVREGKMGAWVGALGAAKGGEWREWGDLGCQGAWEDF